MRVLSELGRPAERTGEPLRAIDFYEQAHGLIDTAASIGESLSYLFTPEGQQGLYRLVMYRDLPVRIDSYNYTLYIRNDLIPLYNQIRY